MDSDRGPADRNRSADGDRVLRQPDGRSVGGDRRVDGLEARAAGDHGCDDGGRLCRGATADGEPARRHSVAPEALERRRQRHRQQAAERLPLHA